MVVREKNLFPRDINGKRYRTHPLLLMGIVCLLPTLFLVYDILFVRIDRDTIRLLLQLNLISLIPSIFFLVLDRFFASSLLCVLSDERVYFFKSQVFVLNTAGTRKKEWFGDGSILYTDIKYMEYISAVRCGKRTVRASAVVILGFDFQVTVEKANKRLIRMIRKQGGLSARSDEANVSLPDFDAICYERKGLWNGIWTYFEENGSEKLLDDDTELLFFELNEKTNEIELELMRNGNKFVFVLDPEDVTMCETRTDTDKNIPLTEFSNVKELCTRMRAFITEYAGSP